MTSKPAFPIASLQGDYNESMSLREWWAGMALQGLLSNAYIIQCMAKDGDIRTIGERISKDCFTHADMMIKESEKPYANL